MEHRDNKDTWEGEYPQEGFLQAVVLRKQVNNSFELLGPASTVLPVIYWLLLLKHIFANDWLSNHDKTWLGCCVQGIPAPVTLFCTMWLIMTKSAWVVVCNVSLNLVNLLSSMWIIMTNPGWGVVHNVSQNPVSLLCTMWLIITKLGQAVVYNVFQNPVSLLCTMYPRTRSPCCVPCG